MGRTSKTPEEKRNAARILIMLNAGEAEIIEAASGALGLPPATFCRVASLQVARRTKS